MCMLANVVKSPMQFFSSLPNDDVLVDDSGGGIIIPRPSRHHYYSENVSTTLLIIILLCGMDNVAEACFCTPTLLCLLFKSVWSTAMTWVILGGKNQYAMCMMMM